LVIYHVSYDGKKCAPIAPPPDPAAGLMWRHPIDHPVTSLALARGAAADDGAGSLARRAKVAVAVAFAGVADPVAANFRKRCAIDPRGTASPIVHATTQRAASARMAIAVTPDNSMATIK
jgi:hypothetical protein